MKLRNLAVAVFASVAGTAFAGMADPGVDQRQAHQHARKQLDRDLNRSSHDIYHQKHDAQGR